jgi:hypothetical protein
MRALFGSNRALPRGPSTSPLDHDLFGQREIQHGHPSIQPRATGDAARR